jgi:hypothetical protein
MVTTTGDNGNNTSPTPGSSRAAILQPPQLLNPLAVLPTNNVVENSYIGTDASGANALGNGLTGIDDEGSLNTFGGTSAVSANVISGNNAGGIKSTGSVTISWNDIGTDATGNVALGNGAGAAGISASGYPSNVANTT